MSPARALLALLLALAPAAPSASAGVEEVPPATQVKGSQRLTRGWVILLEEGRPERWESLPGPDGKPRRGKRLSQGRPELVMLGRGRAPLPVWIPKVTRATRSLTVTATAYDPGPEANGRSNVAATVTGERARFGIAAVDPTVIPLKSWLYVEGYGVALAADIGGAIKGRRVDLCFNSTAEAEAFGRKKARVWVLSGLRKSSADKVLDGLRKSGKIQ